MIAGVVIEDMRLVSIYNLAFILIACFCFGAPNAVNGQSYNTSLGLRLGDGIGMTARQRILKRTTLEGIFYQHHPSDQTIAGLMLDHHMPVLTKRLNMYLGGGIGRGFPKADESTSVHYNALMLNAGLEFTIARLNLSWDFVPVIPLTDQDDSLTTLTAFSLRYVLIKKSKDGLFENDQKKKKKNIHKKKHKRKMKKR